MGPFLVGENESDLRDRAARLGAASGRDADAALGSVRTRGVAGTVGDVVRFLESLGEAGVQRVLLQHLLTDDDGHLALLAEAAAEARVA